MTASKRYFIWSMLLVLGGQLVLANPLLHFLLVNYFSAPLHRRGVRKLIWMSILHGDAHD